MSKADTKCIMVAVIGAPPDREGGQLTNSAPSRADREGGQLTNSAPSRADREGGQTKKRWGCEQ